MIFMVLLHSHIDCSLRTLVPVERSEYLRTLEAVRSDGDIRGVRFVVG